ncbi:helix-turn-helix transcriptional regulator [Streptomyces sp. NBC_00102]|uniref:helix-turn-helix domain-containing protein n=1 Tax=Streptomyces sp. NBC_00102 TaxID=2975652 RepID=UPI00224FE1D8|nr:helix-turn-helix transcriptional regulator [Streptomyces sp. NBC_00102]MCX5398840.1 helix-turn-helix domain-containing protein [Streptomyces sp. NBC_00102]
MGTEIQDFAAALVALKERSGMSYGTLAKRLHMSTSTVHRYCNGDAVPPEFAPVERMARLCRATPDEMVELHRQWILADQAKKQGGARREQAPSPVPAAPAAAPSWARPAEAEAESAEDGQTEQETEAGPKASSDAAPIVSPAPAPAPIPAPTSIPAPAPLPAASEAEGPLVTGRQDKAGGPRRPRSRRTRVLLAAAVVVALSVPSAIVARNLAGGSDDGRNADATGATATAVRNASPTPSRKPSTKPSASASASASPSPSATASDGPDATASPAKKGTVSSDEVPLRATITSYNWDAPCGQYTLLDDDPSDVPPPPPPQSSRGWAKALGGVDGGSQLLEVTLQGSSSEAVVVSALHVRVVTRKAPLAWNSFSMAEGCGSSIFPQSFDIDLDDAQPRTKPVAGKQGDEVVPAQDFPFRTSSTDVQVLNLDAHVEGHDVSYYLELDWTSGDRSGTLRVDDHGEPFRTSSVKARPEYIYWQDRAQWMDKDYTDPAMADEGE